MTQHALGETAHVQWPFTERTGDRAAQDFEVLLADPEQHLTDAEKAEMTRFGQGLIDGRIADVQCNAIDNETGSIIDLQTLDVEKVKTDERTYYTGYFATEKGQQDLEKLGVTSVEDLENVVRNHIASGTEIDKRIWRSASVRSNKWYKSQLMDQLEQPDETDANFATPESFTVHFTPEKLLHKFSAYKDYKEFYGQVDRALQKEPPSALRNAKETLLAVQRAKLNFSMAALYPSMWQLAEQLTSSSPMELTGVWLGKLSMAAPLVARVYVQPDQAGERRRRFVEGFGRRLDLLRYGAVYVAPGENYSPVSPKLYEVLEEYRGGQTEEPMIAPEVRDVMQNTTWNSEQFKAFLEAILDELDLLSEEQAVYEDIEDRSRPASDNKWQVVESENADNLSTDNTKKVMLVTVSYERNLVQQDPSGPLPVGAHETEHVLQGEANDRQAKTIPMARIGGRRAGMLMEAGGVREEKPVFALLGVKRRLNEFYLRGLERKLAGGNVAQVVRTVYNVVVQTSDREPSAATRDYAVTRALRLYRYDGHNSQPLDYLEQEVALKSLEGRSDEEVRALVTGTTAFMPMDAAALHRVGILELPDASEIPIPAHTALKVYMEKFYKPEK